MLIGRYLDVEDITLTLLCCLSFLHILEHLKLDFNLTAVARFEKKFLRRH